MPPIISPKGDKMKTLSTILVASMLATASFGADLSDKDIQKLAEQTAAKSVKIKKQASELEAKIATLCKEQFALRSAAKDLNAEQRAKYFKELKYQKRQAVSKLGRDDIYNEGVCRGFVGHVGLKGARYGMGADIADFGAKGAGFGMQQDSANDCPMGVNECPLGQKPQGKGPKGFKN